MPSRDVDSARRAIDFAISGPRDRKSQALTKSRFGINTNGPIKTDAILDPPRCYSSRRDITAYYVRYFRREFSEKARARSRRELLAKLESARL